MANENQYQEIDLEKLKEIIRALDSKKISLLNFKLYNLFQIIRKTLNNYNLKENTLLYRETCELLSKKFEELKLLINVIDSDKIFMEFLKTSPKDDDIAELLNSSWLKPFEMSTLSEKEMLYSVEKYCKEKIVIQGIKHLSQTMHDQEMILEAPKYMFSEKIKNYYNEIKSFLPCRLEELFENEQNQIKIYEKFVYLLHLIQMGKIKYQKETKLFY
ncbi:MAG: hypothetical protein ACTSUL_08975 [Promethearchaeota archaeon]